MWVCYKCTLYNHVIYYMICLICTIVCWVCYKCTLYNHNLHKYISLYDMPDLDNYVCVLLAYCVSMRLSLSLCFLLCTVMCTLCMCQLNGPPKVCWSLMFCSCFLQQWHQSKGSADTSAKPDFSAHPYLSNFSRCMVKAEILHQMRTGWIMYTHLVSQMDTSCYLHMILKKIQHILTITMSEV